jgi:UDP-N-acetylmuramyl tripeptide synthase
MGFAVGESADVAIVTSDNPRTEDPESIAAAVADGVRAAGAEPLVVLDRREAIARALEIGDSRSLVLVAGKGHEAYQTIGDRRISLSDQEVLRSEAGRERCV